MNCSHERATLVDYRTKRPIANSTQVQGDDWVWLLRITDTELTGASLIFTAKSCIEDPDPGEIQLSSSVTTEIEILTGATANRMDAIIRVPSTLTENINIPMEMASINLLFDVQLMRAGTPVRAPKRETFFRHNNSKFTVIKDVTKATAAPVITPP